MDYKARIDRVLDYIESHIDQQLNLKKLADIANFSPFHFHRLFKLIIGEPLNQYIIRRRVEHAAIHLIHRRDESIKEVAFAYGFNDLAAFSRAFKKYFKVSPSNFRKENKLKYSKISQLLSKNGQEYPSEADYHCIINKIKNWTIMNANIRTQEFSEMKLATLSIMGPNNIPSAFQKIVRWATPKSLVHENSKMMIIYHDSFKVTEEHKVRMETALVLDSEIESDGEIQFKTFNPGRCIVGRYEIGFDEFENAWTGLFVWMNDNGYEMSDQRPFDVYHNNPMTHPQNKAIVDFCIPVK